MNVIARLEYELEYYNSAVHRFNHYTTRTPFRLCCVNLKVYSRSLHRNIVSVIINVIWLYLYPVNDFTSSNQQLNSWVVYLPMAWVKIQKTKKKKKKKKRYLITFLLNTQHYKRYVSRVKWSNPRKGVALYPTLR